MAQMFGGADGLVLVLSESRCLELTGWVTATVTPGHQGAAYMGQTTDVRVRATARARPPWLNRLRTLMAIETLKGCEASARGLADLLADEVSRQSLRDPPVSYDALLAENAELKARVLALEREAEQAVYAAEEDY